MTQSEETTKDYRNVGTDTMEIFPTVLIPKFEEN